jgi:hypothetical protein
MLKMFTLTCRNPWKLMRNKIKINRIRSDRMILNEIINSWPVIMGIFDSPKLCSSLKFWLFPTTPICQFNDPSIVSNWSLTERNCFQIRQAWWHSLHTCAQILPFNCCLFLHCRSNGVWLSTLSSRLACSAVRWLLDFNRWTENN